MKTVTLTITAVFIMCFAQMHAQNAKVETLQEFLKGILTLEQGNINLQEPIASVNVIAAKNAGKTIVLTKGNIGEALQEAQQYKNNLITVDDHTIVKITDFSKCSPSGLWGTCMPYGEDYIQKGEFISMKDYINYIIGRPDDQIRTLYLFNVHDSR
jgi:hypothetical protein